MTTVTLRGTSATIYTTTYGPSKTTATTTASFSATAIPPTGGTGKGSGLGGPYLQVHPAHHPSLTRAQISPYQKRWAWALASALAVSQSLLCKFFRPESSSCCLPNTDISCHRIWFMLRKRRRGAIRLPSPGSPQSSETKEVKQEFTAESRLVV